MRERGSVDVTEKKKAVNSSDYSSVVGERISLSKLGNVRNCAPTGRAHKVRIGCYDRSPHCLTVSE